jgi:hypothetical protein
MVDFKEVRVRVPLPEAARWLGFVPRKGFILCPFHQEKTPSLKISSDHYHCFGCGASGDVTSFTAHVLGISQLEAAQRLSASFNVPNKILSAPTPQETLRINRLKLLSAWKVAAYDEICVSTRVCVEGLASDDAKTRELAKRKLEQVENVSDQFLTESAETLFRKYGLESGKGELDAIIRIGRRYRDLSKLCGGNQLNELERYSARIMAGDY